MILRYVGGNSLRFFEELDFSWLDKVACWHKLVDDTIRFRAILSQRGRSAVSSGTYNTIVSIAIVILEANNGELVHGEYLSFA